MPTEQDNQQQKRAGNNAAPPGVPAPMAAAPVAAPDATAAALLRARARELAAPPQTEAPAGEQSDVLEFRLSEEVYGIETQFVREVCAPDAITTIPCTPAFVSGVINIRGQIVSVLDLRVFFELPPAAEAGGGQVIVLASENMEFGILADVILGVRPIRLNTLQTSLATLTDKRREYVRGILTGQMVVLDGEKILADPDIVVDDDS